ncbi:MAG: hypothetical protein Q8R28_05855 [Dehalococcoidia bacterium]|nr:hypothetical protein [Dehalococcoidia bacterium]
MPTHRINLFAKAGRGGEKDATPTQVQADEIRKDVVEATFDQIRRRENEIARSRVAFEEGFISNR